MDLNPSYKAITPLDMSESGVTDWFELEKLTTGIDLAWPATGSPVGVVSIELTSDKSDTTRVVVVNSSSMNPAPTQPAGTADRTCWDNIKTCEPFGRVRYTRTSGGTAGVTFLSINVNGKM